MSILHQMNSGTADDDDLYGNFDAPSNVNNENAGPALPPPTAFQGTMHGASGLNPLARPGSKWGGAGAAVVQPVSSYGRGGVLDARPMTSNRASGFSNAQNLGGAAGYGFDPTGQAGRFTALSGPAPALQRRADNGPEDECNDLERKVSQLVDESAIAAVQGDLALALEKAKEAGKKERHLTRRREQLNLTEQHNAELTYAVHFNLAVQYHKSGLHTEALNTYSLIVRNKQYQQAGRLRVNMGNIYVEQKKYQMAIKTYRLALDDIPPTGRDTRFKITRNIGNAYVKMMNYKEAAAAYESIMDGSPDVVTGFNLLLCYFALGEVERLKRCFVRLLQVKVPGMDAAVEELEDDEANVGGGGGGGSGSGISGSNNNNDNAHADVLVGDVLKADIRQRRKHFLTVVTTAARLVGPAIDAKDWRVGYDWVIEQLKQYEIRDSTAKLASELEMCKALNYLKYKKYREAIDGLRAFEKKDKALRARAATNLSYLHFLEGEMENGEKWADIAIEADRYNPRALVNKGNFAFQRGEFDKARDFFNEAINVEADCVEAIYNLGLTTKQMGRYEEALSVFKRLQVIIDSVEVTYQVADLYDLMGDHRASEWFQRLVGRVPTDPNVLGRLGQLHVKDGDESQAYLYYLDAYRYYQVNIDVITWLGAYFVKNEAYDKALQFFQRASEIETREVKWQLMVGSCHRRRGDSASAKEVYESIHTKYPDNAEAVKHLVHICRDLELIDESNEYMKKLRRLEVRVGGGFGPLGGAGAAGSGAQTQRLGGPGNGADDLESSGIMSSSQNPNQSEKSPTGLQRSGMGSFRAFGTGTVLRDKKAAAVDDDDDHHHPNNNNQQQQLQQKKNDDLDLPGL